MTRFESLRTGGRILPIDLDVHVIPAHGDEPEHYDVRCLHVAAPGQALAISDESPRPALVRDDRLDEVAADASVHRLGRKAMALARAAE